MKLGALLTLRIVNNDFNQPRTIFEVMKDLKVKDLDVEVQADGPTTEP